MASELARTSREIELKARMSVPVQAVEVPRSSGGPAAAGARRALVLAHDRASGAALVRALENATFEVDWVRTNSELRARTERSDLPAPTVVFVLHNVKGADDPTLLAELAFRSCAGAEASPAGGRGKYLEEAIRSYAGSRLLSARQQRILGLYLEGMGDKEIASVCGCSEATVYEHWRRMARKAGCHNKGDSIADFHRYLGARVGLVELG
jgi:DNA-binding CsgD family transcriptional regulator